jgi:hypothetical protein
MDGILVTTEMAQGAHRWVVYVTVNSETVTHYFDTQEEATAFANTALGEDS